MKAPEIFGLAIRLLGLSFAYRALDLLVQGLFVNAWSLGYTALNFLVAWWLLRGAPPIERIAYPAKATGASCAGDA